MRRVVRAAVVAWMTAAVMGWTVQAAQASGTDAASTAWTSPPEGRAAGASVVRAPAVGVPPQPHSAARTAGARVPGLRARSARTSIYERSVRPRAASAAARIRSAVLYSAGEFSTFRRQSSPSARSVRETAYRTPPLNQQAEDKWFAIDKAKHVAFSFLWTLGTQYTAVNKGGLSEHRALPISVTSSALIGVTKEYYDLKAGTGHFSRRDLVADAVGILLAVGVILL